MLLQVAIEIWEPIKSLFFFIYSKPTSDFHHYIIYEMAVMTQFVVMGETIVEPYLVLSKRLVVLI